jgi:hypothetical protein
MLAQPEITSMAAERLAIAKRREKEELNEVVMMIFKKGAKRKTGLAAVRKTKGTSA